MGRPEGVNYDKRSKIMFEIGWGTIPLVLFIVIIGVGLGIGYFIGKKKGK